MKTPKVCVYIPDPATPADHRGHVPCVCGLAKTNRRHQLPATPPAAVAAEARRYGDHEGDQ